jgi:integrase
MRKVGLHGVSLHSLRHSHANSLLNKGVPVAVVSDRLGHADQNITSKGWPGADVSKCLHAKG